MGVSGLNQWMLTNFKNLMKIVEMRNFVNSRNIKNILQSIPPTDYLLIDAQSLIHNASGEVFRLSGRIFTDEDYYSHFSYNEKVMKC